MFRCELRRSERIELEQQLRDAIDHNEDQVLHVNLGPVNGHAASGSKALGRALGRRERHAIVI